MSENAAGFRKWRRHSIAWAKRPLYIPRLFSKITPSNSHYELSLCKVASASWCLTNSFLAQNRLRFEPKRKFHVLSSPRQVKPVDDQLVLRDDQNTCRWKIVMITQESCQWNWSCKEGGRPNPWSFKTSFTSVSLRFSALTSRNFTFRSIYCTIAVPCANRTIAQRSAKEPCDSHTEEFEREAHCITELSNNKTVDLRLCFNHVWTKTAANRISENLIRQI